MFSKQPWMYDSSTSFYPYKIRQSMRHNDDAQVSLDKSYGGSGTDASGTTWSFSAWVKRGDFGRRQMIVMWSNSSNIQEDIRFFEDDKLRWYCHNSNGSAADSDLKTNMLFRDNSAWYHILCVKDTTQGTPANRNKIYINGVDQSDTANGGAGFTTSDYSSSNYASYAGLNHNVSVGGPSTGGSSNHLDGYLAEVQFINGTALGPEYFGETKEGIWIPKKSYKDQGGDYGTNGFYLKYQLGAEGTDSSGKGTTFTAQNFSDEDIVKDSPTNNFATLNNLKNVPAVTFLEANLRANVTNVHKSVYANQIIPTGTGAGKYYFEAHAISGSANKFTIGLSDEENTHFQQSASSNHVIAYSGHNSYNYGDAVSLYHDDIRKNGSITGSNVLSSPITGGDIMMIAFDAESGKVWFGQNGTWVNGSGTASTTLDLNNHDTTVAVGLRHHYHFGLSAENCNWVANFGQDPTFVGTKSSSGNSDGGTGSFYYAPPSDFVALNTDNLMTPTIDPFEGEENPEDHFVTTLYTGTNSTNEKDIGFAPDFLWFKHRNGGSDHALYDSIRGANGGIKSNSADTENTNANSSQDLMSFDNDGFTVGVGSQFGSVNSPGHTIAAWAWKGGGTAVTNNDGGITSSVSANTKAGFSIVTYTGTTSSETVGHGLNSAPEMIWVKGRNVGHNWAVYHQSAQDITANDFFELNSTAAGQTGSNPRFLNGTTGTSVPTSTVFNVNNYSGSSTNNNGNTYVAYCFHSVEGYQKIGAYRGNQDANGPVINCGFRPAFVLFKNIDTAEIWVIYDKERDVHNLVENPLYPNLANSESAASSRGVDFLSNGFKIRGADTSVNKSGNVHIYLAIADQPFKYANAR